MAVRHARVAPGSIWQPTRSGSVRDRILAWERSHDTMTVGSGTDPHGWRNALNYFGWGPNAPWWPAPASTTTVRSSPTPAP